MNQAHEEHLDPTSEIGLETIKKRAVRGVVILTGRTFILTLISTIAYGFLTVFLAPADLGVFIIVSAVVNFLSYFSDIGLGAALIQKHSKPSDDDIKTTFTIQQILVVTLLVVLFVVSPHYAKISQLSPEGRTLLYALGISLLLSSLKTVPSLLLERKLEFGKWAIPQVLESLVYSLVVVLLAWKGFGVNSYTIAVLARGVVGLVAMYIIFPWKPKIGISIKSLKHLLKFGLPYQANTFIAVVKDDGLTIVLGGILGPAGVGFLGWAQKWPQMALRLFMDHVTKVMFPAFSRMQNDKDHLKQSVTRSLFFVCFLVFPSVIGMVVLAPVIVAVVPQYTKWQPALLALTFVSVNTLFAAVSTQITNMFNAIGKIKLTSIFMIMWAILTWAFIPFLAIRFGFTGAAAGYALVGASSIIPILVGYKMVKFSPAAVLQPLAASALMGFVLVIIRQALPQNFYSLWVMVIAGGAVYFVTSVFLIGMSLVDDVKKALRTLVSRE